MKPSVFLLLLVTAHPLRADPTPLELRLRVARAAEAQVGVTTVYDPSWVRLEYPGGDVPAGRGVCADVIVRAFRTIGVDLQQLVHEDMQRHLREYPNLWGLRQPDSSIDHRRVPNLMTFFLRRGKDQPLDGDFEPGDVVAWRLPNGLHHIGIVSERIVHGTRRHLMVHNIGRGTELEDVLYTFDIIGHYRW